MEHNVSTDFYESDDAFQCVCFMVNVGRALFSSRRTLEKQYFSLRNLICEMRFTRTHAPIASIIAQRTFAFSFFPYGNATAKEATSIEFLEVFSCDLVSGYFLRDF